MWNEPTKKQLELIPKLYEQKNVKNKKIYLKFFIGGITWYVAEFDGKDTFFTYFKDGINNEWGYTSFNELKEIKIDGWLEVDRDLHTVNPRKPVKLSSLIEKD